jgi:4-hydroxy-3-methylbut-2-en-1-yl diphosphate reductase
MPVLLAEEMGMCFGVRDALALAATVADPTATTIHGELVHNEIVLQQLGARGFRMRSERDRHIATPTPQLLITAHGISDRERARLLSQGTTLIDTTCPLVRRAHEAAMTFRCDGRFVVVIGKPGHVEVRGIVEDLPDFAVVDSVQSPMRFAADRIGVLCQTTIPPRTVRAIFDAIRTANPHADIALADTTCLPTRKRQSSLLDLLPKVDFVVVVGGKDSNNTRELVDLCREHGVAARRVASADELRAEWFRTATTVGLTAGTSSLDATINEVRERIEEILNADR